MLPDIETPTLRPSMREIRGGWLDDPRLARRLGRMSWLVLVVTLALLVGGSQPLLSVREIALSVMLTLVVGLNAPTALGLYRSRAKANTRLFWLAAGSLVLRAIATGAVLYFAGRA